MHQLFILIFTQCGGNNEEILATIRKMEAFKVFYIIFYIWVPLG